MKISSEIFKKLIFDFFKEVLSDKKIKHYFFNISFDKLLLDQISLNQYIYKKFIKGINTFPLQSASLDIRVSPVVFDMVLLTLQNLLSKFKFSSADNNFFMDQIIKITEETRSQANDLNSMSLSGYNLSIELIQKLMEKSKSLARIIDSSNILVTEGFKTPVNVHLMQSDKVIRLQSFAELMDSKNYEEMLKLKTSAEVGNPFCIFDVLNLNSSFSLYSQFDLSFVNTLPSRLLISAIKEFAYSANVIYELDANADHIMQVRKL